MRNSSSPPLLAVCLLAAFTSPVAPQIPPRAGSGLDRLLGTWVGHGTGITGAVRDSLTFAPTLGGRALRFTMASTTDDGFLAEGFVWEGEVPGAVEIVETSSVQTMRRLLGTQSEGGLILDEVPAERATRVRLDFVGTDSLRLQEITLRTQPPRAFVDEMFLRVAR